jgi:hypothetical protein
MPANPAPRINISSPFPSPSNRNGCAGAAGNIPIAIIAGYAPPAQIPAFLKNSLRVKEFKLQKNEMRLIYLKIRISHLMIPPKYQIL